MSNFTANQKSSISAALTEALEAAPKTDWSPDLSYSVKDRPVLVTEDRQLLVDGKLIGADWKGRSVGSDVAEAALAALEAPATVKPAAEMIAEAKAKAEADRQKLLANRAPPPKPPTSGPDISSKLLVTREPGTMPHTEKC